MKKQILVAIRYSIVQENNKSWRASESCFEEYSKKILSNERLNIREATFENITLPSLCRQKIDDPDVSYAVVIMISDLLPLDRVDRLKSIIRKSNISNLSFELVTIESGIADSYDYKNINEAIKGSLKFLCGADDSIVATVRLDDDDGLSQNFMQKLSSHMRPGMCGYAVSFAYGLEGYWNPAERLISDIRHSYFPKNAFGLAYINEFKQNTGLKDNKTIHVYNLGNHMKIDELYPTVVEAIEPMYFRTLSSTNDSVGSPFHRHLPSVNGRNILKQFSYLERIASDINTFINEQNIKPLEICKSSSPWSILITHLNARIQLREKQLKELNERISGANQ